MASSVRHTNGDYVSIATLWTLTGDWTLCIWVKCNAGEYPSAAENIIYGFGTTGGTSEGLLLDVGIANSTTLSAVFFRNGGSDLQQTAILTGSDTGWVCIAARHTAGSASIDVSYRRENVTTWTTTTLTLGAQVTAAGGSMYIGSDQFAEHAVDSDTRHCFVQNVRMSDATLLTASQNINTAPAGTNVHWFRLLDAGTAATSTGSAGNGTVTGTLQTDTTEPTEAGAVVSPPVIYGPPPMVSWRRPDYSQYYARPRFYPSATPVVASLVPPAILGVRMRSLYETEPLVPRYMSTQIFPGFIAGGKITASPSEVSVASASLQLDALLSASPAEASSTTATLIQDATPTATAAEASSTTATMLLDALVTAAPAEASSTTAALLLDAPITASPAEASSTTAALDTQALLSAAPAEASSTTTSLDIQALLSAAPAEASSTIAAIILDNAASASPAEASTATGELFLENISGLVANPSEASISAGELDLQALLTAAASEASVGASTLMLESLLVALPQEASTTTVTMQLEGLLAAVAAEASSTTAVLRLEALLTSAPAEASTATAELTLTDVQGGSADEVSIATGALDLQALLSAVAAESSLATATLTLQSTNPDWIGQHGSGGKLVVRTGRSKKDK